MCCIKKTYFLSTCRRFFQWFQTVYLNSKYLNVTFWHLFGFHMGKIFWHCNIAAHLFWRLTVIKTTWGVISVTPHANLSSGPRAKCNHCHGCFLAIWGWNEDEARHIFGEKKKKSLHQLSHYGILCRLRSKNAGLIGLNCQEVKTIHQRMTSYGETEMWVVIKVIPAVTFRHVRQ